MNWEKEKLQLRKSNVLNNNVLTAIFIAKFFYFTNSRTESVMYFSVSSLSSVFIGRAMTDSQSLSVFGNAFGLYSNPWNAFCFALSHCIELQNEGVTNTASFLTV